MENPDAYELLHRGRRLLAEGNTHSAVIVLERAAIAEPKKASIREALARALFNSGQTTKAKEEFSMVIELDPSNDFGYFGLGLCYARAGKWAEARGQIKLAIAMRPEIERYRDALRGLPAA